MIPFLLAAGDRNSLNPITTSVATPLMPIANRPVVVYAVELLARQGYREIVVGLGDRAEQIEQTLGNGQRWNVHFHYLLQRQRLGLVDLLTRATSWLTDTCLILPADSLAWFDIQAALHFHQAHGGPATVLLSPPFARQRDSQGWTIDSNYRLHRPSSSAPNVYCDTRIYLVEPEILSVLNQPTPVAPDVASYTLLGPLLDAGMNVYGYRLPGYWNPLTSFAEVQAAQRAALASLMADTMPGVDPAAKLPWIERHYMEEKAIRPGVWSGMGTWLHPSVQVTPPVIIGPGCRIGRHVEVGPNVVIGANCVIDEGATLRESTILPATYVGRLLHIEQRVVQQQWLVDVESSAHVQVADPCLLGSVDVAAPSAIFWQGLERLLALLLLMGVAPMLLVIVSVLWLTAGRPVIQPASRIGRKPTLMRRYSPAIPEVLNLYQLRTRQADGSYIGLGAWLEAWDLYRLPQLWNVVRGELGLVGVMPLTSEAAAQIREPWQQKRYDCQAGFTGLWYTQSVTPDDFDELCIVDTYHAATSNWWRDMQCLWQTPMAWLRRGYGMKERRGAAHEAKPQVRDQPYTRFIDLKLSKPTPATRPVRENVPR